MSIHLVLKELGGAVVASRPTTDFISIENMASWVRCFPGTIWSFEKRPTPQTPNKARVPAYMDEGETYNEE